MKKIRSIIFTIFNRNRQFKIHNGYSSYLYSTFYYRRLYIIFYLPTSQINLELFLFSHQNYENYYGTDIVFFSVWGNTTFITSDADYNWIISSRSKLIKVVLLITKNKSHYSINVFEGSINHFSQKPTNGLTSNLNGKLQRLEFINNLNFSSIRTVVFL